MITPTHLQVPTADTFLLKRVSISNMDERRSSMRMSSAGESSSNLNPLMRRLTQSGLNTKPDPKKQGAPKKPLKPLPTFNYQLFTQIEKVQLSHLKDLKEANSGAFFPQEESITDNATTMDSYANLHLGLDDQNDPTIKALRQQRLKERRTQAKSALKKTMLRELLNDVNAGQAGSEYFTMAELGRQKQANHIYTRYLKEQDKRLELKDKLKVNMGFLAFQTAKQLQPMKFHYREDEGDANDLNQQAQNLKFSKFFKQNPDLIEFMKVTSAQRKEEVEDADKTVTAHKDGKKKKKVSLLKSDKRAKGIYDRFYNPLCPFQREQRTVSATPGAGTYFRFPAPVRVSGIGGIKLIYPKDSLI
ncbi:hypothetical protein FGO68_gene14691 [Halteria grandinella]|uniref:Uncharacterized protein n=1 Tax=Halteria grandinella TaxID=5974 RepID=A0A8J8T0N0_HALGN|nr:hypothetical protein FGO68_gene14691 [Halteria grandinella]